MRGSLQIKGNFNFREIGGSHWRRIFGSVFVDVVQGGWWCEIPFWQGCQLAFLGIPSEPQLEGLHVLEGIQPNWQTMFYLIAKQQIKSIQYFTVNQLEIFEIRQESNVIKKKPKTNQSYDRDTDKNCIFREIEL